MPQYSPYNQPPLMAKKKLMLQPQGPAPMGGSPPGPGITAQGGATPAGTMPMGTTEPAPQGQRWVAPSGENPNAPSSMSWQETAWAYGWDANRIAQVEEDLASSNPMRQRFAWMALSGLGRSPTHGYGYDPSGRARGQRGAGSVSSRASGGRYSRGGGGGGGGADMDALLDMLGGG